MLKKLFLVSVLAIFFAACTRDNKRSDKDPVTSSKTIDVPKFDADSAYYFIERQVAFGPRIPNTPSHRKTGDYLIKTLERLGARVTIQDFEQVTFDGQRLSLRNIIASFFVDKQKRVLLAAHWDTRPFSDKDPEKPNGTFEGANDGGSGVGVLLEIARILKGQKSPAIGIDIIFFDGEDWGEKEGDEPKRPPAGLESWWCLGSQYWAIHKHQSTYSAYYGILLDMVGGKNAQFHREGYSLEFAPSIVDKVWNTAARLGYSHIFVKQNQQQITDDHYFISRMGKIPTIDIVHFEPGIGYFGDFHHTQKDNMSLISKETLKAVGETILNVVYYEE
jgi:glutaminyl-peptide cyclotransferase